MGIDDLRGRKGRNYCGGIAIRYIRDEQSREVRKFKNRTEEAQGNGEWLREGGRLESITQLFMVTRSVKLV